MEAQRDLDSLPAYASPVLKRLLASGAVAGVHGEDSAAVMLLADISGFTQLTTTLAQQGPDGAETLSLLLNDHFGRIVDLVAEAGGEIVDFAGDAAAAVWFVSPPELRAAAAAAARCGLAIARSFPAPANATALSVRVAIGSGRVLAAVVGGVDDRWHSLVSGRAWRETLRADAVARAGQVVLAPDAAALLGALATGRPAADECVAVERVGPSDPVQPAAIAVPSTAAVVSGVPRAVVKRVLAGQTGWLAEFRTVTSLFAAVADLQYDTVDAIAQLQTVASTMQRAVHRFGGSINRLMVDDKGTVLVAAWGVALHTYEDSPARAALAGIEIRDTLRAAGFTSSVGITTGRAFAGTIGNGRRKQYALHGETINTAARLMQAAAGDVLCDQPTRGAARRRILFAPSRALTLKGASQPCRASAALRAQDPERFIVDCEAEDRALADLLARVEDGGTTTVAVVRGEPGIGKSTLLAAFRRRAQSSRCRLLTGGGEALDRSSAYGAWRTVYDQLLGFDSHALPAVRWRRIEALMRDAPTLGYAPLVNHVLGLDRPDSEVTTRMSHEARADAARAFLVALFEAACHGTPAAIVLDDGHWIDSASWGLAAALCAGGVPLMLVIATRPMQPDDMSGECTRMLARAETVIDLTVLAPPDAVELARRRLDVDELPGSIVDLVQARAEGHPFFTEQLVQALVERGVIRVDNHECIVTREITSLPFPETVQGVVRGRIDLLTPAEQLTLKVASVLGRAIDVDALRQLHPVGRGADLDAELARMAQLDLLQVEAGTGGDRVYAFKHAITQEVAYELLPFAQRRDLHRAAAQLYEHRHAGALDSVWPLLAHHWTQAGETGNAMAALERAGDDAIRAGHFREAAGFLSQALAMHDATGAPDSLRRGRWLLQLGQASYGMGLVDDARDYYARAASALDGPIPSGARLQQCVGIGTSALRVSRRRLRRPSPIDPDSPEGRRRYELASVLSGAAPIYYLDQNSLLWTYSMVRMLDLAQGIPPSSLLAVAQSNVAILFGFAGAIRLADRWFAEAYDVAEALREPLTAARVLYGWSVLDAGLGRWSSGIDRADRAARTYEEYGEHRARRDANLVEAYMYTFTGDDERALARYLGARREPMHRENLVQAGWAYLGLTKVHAKRGEFSDALSWADEGLRTLAGKGDRVSTFCLVGFRAWVQLQLARYEPALADIREAFAALESGRLPVVVTASEGHGMIAATALGLLEAHGALAAGTAREVESMASRACASLRRSARLFPAVRPAAAQWSAVLDVRSGRRRRAARRLRQGLAVAESLQMPRETAALRADLARLHPTS